MFKDMTVKQTSAIFNNMILYSIDRSQPHSTKL